MLAIRKLHKFLRDSDGTAVVEYAVMLALLLMAIYAAIEFTGIGSGRLYDDSNQSLQEAGLGS